ncbi:tyrosine-type recombinase/integrase [Streptomyces sp. NPDC087298]|uniref:tyrosine-type recombinase/integrase n=1 Tax=Streptomyces sp. NPDC087298 TaxID=3365779 RepID=UPI003818B4B0
MVYIKGHSIPTSVEEWKLARVAELPPGASGHKAAAKAAQHISTLSHSLGVPPEELPHDAVARHFMGRDDGAPSTCRNYGISLKQWHRWVKSERQQATGKPQRAPEGADHPDIQRWVSRLAPRVAHGTVNGYRRDVCAIMRLSGHGPREITEDDVLDYLAACQVSVIASKGTPMKASYYNRILSSVKSLCFELRLPNVTEFIHRARRDKKRHKAIDRGDLQHLVTCALQDRQSPNPLVADMGRRMYTVSKLMSSMGLRISEASAVRPADLVQVDGRWCIEAEAVTVKGQEHLGSVFLPVTDAVFEDLTTNYQLTERITPEDWTADKASKKFSGYALGKGVTTTAHKLRAYYATNLYYQSQFNIMLVMRRMRHSDFATTAGYISDLDTAEERILVSTFDDDLVMVPDHPQNVVPLARAAVAGERRIIPAPH